MAEFDNATKAEVLAAVMRFYKTQFGLPDNAIFPTVEPLNPPAIPPGGDLFFSVSLGDGSFPFEEQDDEQVREDTDFIVTGYTRMQLDRANRDESFLLDPKRGALAMQAKLLLIVGQELTREGGAGLLASRVYAKRSHRPNYDAQKGIGWTGITFGVEFDWKIEGAEDRGDD